MSTASKELTLHPYKIQIMHPFISQDYRIRCNVAKYNKSRYSAQCMQNYWCNLFEDDQIRNVIVNRECVGDMING